MARTCQFAGMFWPDGEVDVHPPHDGCGSACSPRSRWRCSPRRAAAVARSRTRTSPRAPGKWRWSTLPSRAASGLPDESELRIKVRNADNRADTQPRRDASTASAMRKENQDLSDPQRPIWTVEEGPDNAEHLVHEYLGGGRVPKGQTRTLVWKVSAVRAGTYTLRFRVDARPPTARRRPSPPTAARPAAASSHASARSRTPFRSTETAPLL